jgi:hypothetical protein
MEKIYKIFETKYTNPITIENYKSRVRTLLDKLDMKDLYDVIKNPAEYYPKIREIYPSIVTRKNILTPILVILREDESIPEEARKQWRQYHDDLSRYAKVEASKSQPSEKQVSKYTSFEEIQNKYNDLGRYSPHETHKKSMQYLLLSIVIHLRPKRADLGTVKIYYDKNPNKTDENYIVLRKRGSSYLVMNIYKTNKFYHTVEEDLPEQLVGDIQTSLRRFPRTYLFETSEHKPMKNNTYSKFFQRAFEDMFGKSLGPSLLRHIFISEKLDFNNMSIAEQEEEAKLMLHTRGLQQQYKWAKKTFCPKLCVDYFEKHPEYIPRTSKTLKNTKEKKSKTYKNKNRK